jgi:oligoribonuclease (3'-5' exoribonuclease)
MVVLCQLKEMDLSCFGCCGNDYNHKRKLMKDIRKNTWEFNKSKSIKSFMTRTTELKSSGICANAIFKDGNFFCPGHPILNQGRDYRGLDKDCEKEEYDGCKAYILFQTWDKQKQKQFLDFIKSKKLDSFAYSIRMDNDSLLKEFEKKK